MEKYHKIQSIFKRDMSLRARPLIIDKFSLIEFEYLRSALWTCNEKVDGTNIRIGFSEGILTIAGRNDKSEIPDNLNTKLLSIFDDCAINKLKSTFTNNDVVIYGEGYGEKIQNGGKYCKGNDFVIFDIKIGDYYLERPNLEDISSKLGIYLVPEIMTCTLDEAIEFVKSKPESSWGNFTMEGLVAVPSVPLLCRNGDRIITKIKCCDFR